MEVDEEENRIFHALTLSFGWLTKQELCNVSTLNSDFLVAARQDYLWHPTLSELEEMGLHDTVYKGYEMLYYPPRIHGELRDEYSYYPHPRDKVARRHVEDLVLVHKNFYGSEMKMENGKLYDCFHRARDPVYKLQDFQGKKKKIPEKREEIWLARDFPILCDTCVDVVVLNDESEMVHHCRSYDHVVQSKPEEDRFPPEYVDPRHDPEYGDLSVFHKARVMSEYRNKIVSAVRAVPVDEDAMDAMRHFVKHIRVTVTMEYQHHIERGYEFRTESDYDTAIANCTLDRVIETAVEKFVVEGFLEE